MNMNSLLGISRAGMNSLQKNLDNVANNIANVNTNGYQAQSTHFKELINNAVSTEDVLYSGNAAQYGWNVGSAATTGTSFGQGILTASSQPLDVAIQGTGFFGVRNENNELLLTRAGNFQLDAEKGLVTSDGYQVAMTNALPANQWPNAEEIQIDSAGRLMTTQNGQTVMLGQLTLYNPTNTDDLVPVGSQLFQTQNAQLTTSQANPAAFGTINQNYLEGANVDLASSMTELMTTQRAYALNSKAMQTTDDMLAVVNRFTN
jgi:flagellar basal-body rod protein FlgG